MRFNFEKLSKSYRKKKLLVVGDVILDAYVWGIVNRMSPEAPVPIVQSGEHGQQPGGAANVALNLTNLGAKVSLVGLVGDDDEGAFGFCSIPEYDNKADCEANGGTWTDLDVNTDLDNVDTSMLTNELALQLDELSKCFADPNLKEYLEDL